MKNKNIQCLRSAPSDSFPGRLLPLLDTGDAPKAGFLPRERPLLTMGAPVVGIAFMGW